MEQQQCGVTTLNVDKQKRPPEPERDLANEWRRMRVVKAVPTGGHGIARRPVRELHGELCSFYNLCQAYERAHEPNDPYLSPHGFFRKLAHGNTRHALEFLENFGPLELSAGQRSSPICHVGVNLEGFWRAHSRFCLVAELWESRDDRTRLAAALESVYRHRHDLSQVDAQLICTEFGPPPSNKHRPFKFPWEPSGYPWDKSNQEPREWLDHAKLVDLRNCAFYVINLELNLHMRNRHIVWQRSWEVHKEGWRPVIWTESLSSAIWEFWGWDTAGISWRRCPHCERWFYPKRRDQLYCTPRQQALASKRDYARRSRARQRRAKKLENRLNKKQRKEVAP